MKVSPATQRARQPAESVQRTLQALDETAGDTSLASITGLGIRRVRALKREIAEIFPASNLPAFLLQGLLQLRGRTLERERVFGDLRVLFRETRQISLYSAFLVTPALIVHGYQRLLTLAGKDVASAFPDGTWQFYTEYGLREDAARHCVETRGFRGDGLSPADAAACWVYAAMHTLYKYDELLAAEWRERAALRCIDLTLRERAGEALGPSAPKRGEERERALAPHVAALQARYGLAKLGPDWAGRRPYHGPSADPIDGYLAARQRAFDAYLERRLAVLPPDLRDRVHSRLAEWQAQDLANFQTQMSVHATLRSESFCERRDPLPFEMLCVALVSGGAYHLIEICERDEAGHLVITPRDGDPARPGQSLPLVRDAEGGLADRYGRPVTIDRRGNLRVDGLRLGRLRLAPFAKVRSRVAAAMRAAPPLGPGEAAELGVDELLAWAPRGRQEQLRGLLGAQTRGEIELLRRAAIVVNWDDHGEGRPLGQLRRAKRGCGDHALTIFRAGSGVVFDMSHIFFDGIWGATLAEIVTGFATALTRAAQGRAPAADAPPALRLAATPAFLAAATEAQAQAPAEADAETREVSLAAINGLRRKLAAREIELTVNDFLLLARYEHAASYRPGPAALAALDDLAARGQAEAVLCGRISAWLEAQRSIVPALLVPMDASWVNPRDRLQPATLRNPSPDLLPLLASCEDLLRRLIKEGGPEARTAFEEERTRLCGELMRFGAVLRALREITTRGESFTAAALRLMAHLPRPTQSLLDQIPQRIDVLNEIVKGTEVFSNIGQVAGSSSLARFMSSRDDGVTKQLTWGVMADARGHLVITLRDFRPHVGELIAAGYPATAELLAVDFLAAYAAAATGLVKRLTKVLAYK